MAAHSGGRLEGSLQIDRRTRAELDQRRLPEGLRREADGEFRGGSVEIGDGEAGAVDGDAIAELDVRDYSLGGDRHDESAAVVIDKTQMVDFSHFFDDAGEEGFDGVVMGDAVAERGGYGLWRV